MKIISLFWLFLKHAVLRLSMYFAAVLLFWDYSGDSPLRDFNALDGEEFVEISSNI